MTADTDTPADDDAENPSHDLSSPAGRALAEAEDRRRKAEREGAALPKEEGGRKGPEPTRYGDWEKSGIVSDF